MHPGSPPLLDAHVHLHDAAFDADRQEVLSRAAAGGVSFLLDNGVAEPDWPALLSLARRERCVLPAFGLHPWYVRERTPAWRERLEQHLDAVPSVVGEIGLDRGLEVVDSAAQEEVFRAQLEVARRRGLPVSIHCVRAWDWLAGVLASEPPLPAGLLLHACAAPVELLPWLLDRGGYCSFAGNALRQNHHRAHATVRAVPRDRLLLETDAPDLPPPRAFLQAGGAGGKVRNEPGNLPAIAHGIAALRGEPVEVLVAAAWENARRLLGPIYPVLRAEPNA